MNIEQQVKQIVDQVITDLTDQIQEQVLAIITKQISTITSNIDYQTLFEAAIISSIKNKQFIFPDASIPGTSVEQSTLVITGEQINGGIIKNFGSTGIDDKANSCQLSIFDEATVVENNLLTKDLTVKGTATIEGDLIVTGTVPETSPFYIGLVNAATNNVRTSLDRAVFENYADIVFKQIKEAGLDLNKVTINGKAVVDGYNLGDFISSSNLQKVGVLRELQVAGESLLAETLYVTGKRVGVNTIEPSQALSIWDQEVEIGIGKLSNNTAVLGTPRNQSLIISSNGKTNIAVLPDGSIAVEKLSLGAVTMSAGDKPPANDQPKGTIVFNSNPSLGGPMGWVSLGGARWANFGVID